MNPPKSPPRLASLLCLLVLLAGFGGCGSESETSSRPHPDTDRPKGASPDQETRGPAISANACQTLRRAVEEREAVSARAESEPSPPSSGCTISGPGLNVSVVLNAVADARRDYFDWIAELAQGSAGDPDAVPHPVAGLGGPSAGRSTANWVAASGTLYVLRGNRWVTASYGVAGISPSQQKARTVELAETTYRLIRRAAGPRPSASPGRR